MRVVIDTNILISACWKPGGLEAGIVRLAVSHAVIACVTPPVLAEYREVLMRDKFVSVRPAALQLLAQLEPRVLTVQPGARIQASPDDDDNRFLECAVAAHADYLITGNLRHYPAKYANTSIVNARQFLDANP